MPAVFDNMVLLTFGDGEFLVPFYWANLPSFRRGPEYGARKKALPFNYAEAQAIANRDMDRNITKAVMEKWANENRVR